MPRTSSRGRSLGRPPRAKDSPPNPKPPEWWRPGMRENRVSDLSGEIWWADFPPYFPFSDTFHVPEELAPKLDKALAKDPESDICDAYNDAKTSVRSKLILAKAPRFKLPKVDSTVKVAWLRNAETLGDLGIQDKELLNWYEATDPERPAPIRRPRPFLRRPRGPYLYHRDPLDDSGASFSPNTSGYRRKASTAGRRAFSVPSVANQYDENAGEASSIMAAQRNPWGGFPPDVSSTKTTRSKSVGGTVSKGKGPEKTGHVAKGGETAGMKRKRSKTVTWEDGEAGVKRLRKK